MDLKKMLFEINSVTTERAKLFCDLCSVLVKGKIKCGFDDFREGTMKLKVIMDYFVDDIIREYKDEPRKIFEAGRIYGRFDGVNSIVLSVLKDGDKDVA